MQLLNKYDWIVETLKKFRSAGGDIYPEYIVSVFNISQKEAEEIVDKFKRGEI